MPWSFYRTVTIAAAKCGASNSTDFPVAFFGTYTYLKTVGNGGDVTSSSGFDIVFYTDATATTKYDFELVTYSPTTGAIEMHVRIPTLSHTVDTVIYLFYGNSSVTTDQGTTATWNSGFGGVYHLPDGSSLTFADSTSNANNGSGVNAPAAAAGQIDGGMLTDASGQKYAEIYNSASLQFTTFTIDFWVKSTGGGFNPSFDPLVSKDDQVLARYWGTWVISSKLYIEFPQAGGNWSGNTSLPAATWLKATYTYDGTDVRIYLNGVIDMTPATHAFSDGAGLGPIIKIGARPSQYITATFDETRFSNVARSADWILTEYNNQFDPTTFYAIGAATPAGGGGGGVSGSQLDRIINLAVRIH